MTAQFPTKKQEGIKRGYYSMKIEKLPSGNYRIRKQVDGKRYSVVVPYKPSTKKEASQLIEDKINGTDVLHKSFKECARDYIDGKAPTLSPATVRGYESVLKMLPDTFDKDIGSITPWDVQVYISSLTAKGKSPKTVRNYHGFISAVFSVFLPEVTLSTKLPQKSQETDYVPSDDDVKRILDAVKGSDYEVPLRLACYGLRRSEICALTMDDLDGNLLTIDKAKVLGTDREWHIKSTKTESSNRTIYIDDSLRDLIKEKGMYEGYPNRIYWHLRKTQDALGIPRFPLHYLRHYYASTAHALGLSDAVIMESGGWKTDYVMKRVYRHAQDVEEKQKTLAEHMKNL